MALHYETVDASDAVESVSAPCPLSPTGFCSLNGACRKGTCSCFSGFIGESCTNAVICPEDLTTCTSTTCDPVCLHSQNDVIVVSENGDDTQGTGELMDTSTSGTDPKAVKSLRRALELATSGQTILLYPGIYTGVDNCGVTVSTASLLIRGLRGPIPTIVDCKNILRGLIIISDAAPNRLEGFRIQNTLASTDGGAIKVTDTAVEMKNMVITNANSRQNGGAIYAYQSQLTFTNVEITKCSAAKGGAIFLDNSDLILDDSIITLSSASEGGGIYAQNSVSVSGDKDSNLWQNHASINGGGLCISGSFTGTTLNVLENTALVGAGLTATSGSSTLSGMKVIGNRATNHGGGIAMLNSANLVLQNSTIQTNHADRNGGGVYILSNGSFENTLASEISNCTAASGGGFYTGDWSRPTVRNLRVVSSSATTSGGCAAFSCSSATVTNPSFEKCDAALGGGVYVDAGSKVLLLQASIAECTATNGAGMYIGSSSVIGGSDVSSVVRDSHADSAAGGVYITGFHSSIEFFDVQNCSASIGGGVVAQEASSATMKSVQVVNNKATTSGGGLHAQNSTIQVEPVTVSSNRAVVGGGVYAIDSSLSGIITVDQNNGERGGGVATSGISLLEGATISANTASQRGGGVSVETGLFSLRSTIIQSCSVPQGVGGGISIVDADVKHYALKIESCASIRGGGIYVNSSSFYQYPTEESTGTSLNAASLTKNRAVEYGGSVFVDGEETTVSDLVITESHAPFGGGLAAQDATSCVVLNADISYSSASTSGGGLLFGSGTSCVIRDSWVMNNQARESGGGVMIFEATLYHSNVDISNNVAPTAGGVYLNSVLYSASLLSWDDGATQRSRIDANIIEPIGGNGANVVMNCTSNCTLSGCVISGANLQFGQGAGVFVLGRGNAVISNSLVANNSAIKGGGIAVSDAEKTVLENVGFIGNIATDSGGGLWAESSAFLPEVDLMSCVFYNNSAKTSGGAISLYGVYLYSSVLLVMENHAGNSESGIGGGLFSDKRVNPDRPSSVMADTWLFLSNDAPVGGSIAGVKSSEISLLDANITRDTGRFFTGVFVGREAILAGYKSQFIGNGGVTTSGKNEGGGAISCVDGIVKLTSCTFINNTALVGGAIHFDRGGSAAIMSSVFEGNTADQNGGAIATSVKAKVTIALQTLFENNVAHFGGAMAVSGTSTFILTSVDFRSNRASEVGGALFITDQAKVTMKAGELAGNIAVFGGALYSDDHSSTSVSDAKFIRNSAFTRGGAIYYQSIDNATITRITCKENTAPSGGCIFWVSEDEDLTPTYPCTSCTMEFNEVYDIATNTRDVQVMWWPENMTSGVPILEPPDEESIQAIKTRNESLERKMHVWPRLKAVDLYGQVEVLDNQTECMVSDGLCSEQTERLLFEPRALIRSAGGVISYRGASFTAANRTPEEGIYTTDISCTLPRSERRFFVQSVKLLPCQPGYSVNQG
ncbi:Nucleolar protein 8 [Phytophthora nicotianae]|uniref:Nucleolar protein 8 n=1 Tax=Phytophthora nicotianae TaxID=4792 RepID=A0A0W8DS23_PHYNI|nr:Nucleolar protein 8 [Phytophthora nicotianae]